MKLFFVLFLKILSKVTYQLVFYFGHFYTVSIVQHLKSSLLLCSILKVIFISIQNQIQVLCQKEQKENILLHTFIVLPQSKSSDEFEKFIVQFYVDDIDKINDSNERLHEISYVWDGMQKLCYVHVSNFNHYLIFAIILYYNSSSLFDID